MTANRYTVRVTRSPMTNGRRAFVSFVAVGYNGAALFFSSAPVEDAFGHEKDDREYHAWLPIQKSESGVQAIIAGSNLNFSRRSWESSQMFDDDVVNFFKEIKKLGYTDIKRDLIQHIIGPGLDEERYLELRVNAALSDAGKHFSSQIRDIDSRNPVFVNFKSSLDRDHAAYKKIAERRRAEAEEIQALEALITNQVFAQTHEGFGAF